MEEWQAKRSHVGGAPRLTTGFLDGTHPIVDAYELKVSWQGYLLLKQCYPCSSPICINNNVMAINASQYPHHQVRLQT